MSDKKTSLWDLFISFCKIGVLTFGGGVAMLPMLEREVVEKHSWTTEENMLDYYAIGQCTPGIIAVNVATFIGYLQRGIIGGIVATIGVIFPSVVIITSLASVLQIFQDNVYVLKAFAGIRVAVCALMISAIIKLAKKALSNISTIVLAIVAFVLQLFMGVSPIIIVASSIIIGIAVYYSSVRPKEAE
ncbi:MAG: chromate transporter [Sphaerochaetaceae bacterium]|nr:chromate transporter [Sphaerochaetaceae bacterium]